MKKIFQHATLTGIVSVGLFLVLTSFVLKRGGDSYTLSINGNQVIQYYFASKKPLPSLSVNPNAKDKVEVYFSECGKIGASRKLFIRNQSGKILKEWKFGEALNEHTPMTFSSNEISGSGDLGLYYTSATVNEPRKLVSLKIADATSASLR